MIFYEKLTSIFSVEATKIVTKTGHHKEDHSPGLVKMTGLVEVEQLMITGMTGLSQAGLISLLSRGESHILLSNHHY